LLIIITVIIYNDIRGDPKIVSLYRIIKKSY